MKKTALLLTLLLLLVLTAAVRGKGPVDEIIIAHPSLARPVAVSDSDVLDRFDPWGGQYLGVALDWPPNVGSRIPYQVFFFLRDSGGDPELRYVFYYYPGPTGDGGYIYLPGMGEPYYSINTGTIIRGHDGQWHHAMPSWETAFQNALQAPTGSGQGGQGLLPFIALLVAGLGVLFLGGILMGKGLRSRPL